MANYNYFISECLCPHCQANTSIEFQSAAGILDQKEFVRGDKLLSDDISLLKGIVGPDISVYKNKQNFWTLGVGECPQCNSEVWAKLFFVDGIFQSIELHDSPQNPFEWGVIDSAS